jgi:hypothetical protein
MKTWAMLLFLLMVVAGCQSTAWERRGVTSAQLVADTSDCREAARGGRLEVQDTISGRSTLLLPVSELDRPAFAACMRQRGYVRADID